MMKLTKEECLKALESLKPMTIKEFKAKNCLSYIEANRIFEQLINEHFDNNMTTTWHNMVNEVDKLDRENSQLRYDLKFMEINFREAVDHANEFLEKTIALEKALDKACDYLTYLSNQTEEVVFEDGATNTDKEFWKEYLFDETN